MNPLFLKVLSILKCHVAGITMCEHSVNVSVTIKDEQGNRYTAQVRKEDDPHKALDLAVTGALDKVKPDWTVLLNPQKPEKTDAWGEKIEVKV